MRPLFTLLFALAPTMGAATLAERPEHFTSPACAELLHTWKGRPRSARSAAEARELIKWITRRHPTFHSALARTTSFADFFSVFYLPTGFTAPPNLRSRWRLFPTFTETQHGLLTWYSQRGVSHDVARTRALKDARERATSAEERRHELASQVVWQVAATLEAMDIKPTGFKNLASVEVRVHFDDVFGPHAESGIRTKVVNVFALDEAAGLAHLGRALGEPGVREIVYAYVYDHLPEIVRLERDLLKQFDAKDLSLAQMQEATRTAVAAAHLPALIETAAPPPMDEPTPAPPVKPLNLDDLAAFAAGQPASTDAPFALVSELQRAFVFVDVLLRHLGQDHSPEPDYAAWWTRRAEVATWVDNLARAVAERREALLDEFAELRRAESALDQLRGWTARVNASLAELAPRTGASSAIDDQMVSIALGHARTLSEQFEQIEKLIEHYAWTRVRRGEEYGALEATIRDYRATRVIGQTTSPDELPLVRLLGQLKDRP